VAAGDAVVAEALEAPGTAVSELPGLPPIGQAVVKDAEISVEVRRGAFTQAFDDASLVARRYGGYVESSQAAGAQARSGSLVARVPSDRFDEAMSDFRALGTVTSESVSGQVVSQEFVDLEARLRTWESQEAVLLDLMGEATSVEATLRIQRELQDVQFRIEQIKGQLRVLEDRTALATIHLSMVEVGAPVAPQERPSDTRPSLAEPGRRPWTGSSASRTRPSWGSGTWCRSRRSGWPPGSATDGSHGACSRRRRRRAREGMTVRAGG